MSDLVYLAFISLRGNLKLSIQLAIAATDGNGFSSSFL